MEKHFKFIPFPRLETERLILRQATKNDCEEILFLRSDKYINQYIKRPTPRNIRDAEKFVTKITRGIEKGENMYWAITIKGRTKMIGSISLWNFSSDRTKGEVGYDLSPEFQNQGIMSEALKEVLNFGFKNLELDEIEAFTHYKNEASKRMLIKNNFNHIENRKDKDDANNIIFEIKTPQK